MGVLSMLEKNAKAKAMCESNDTKKLEELITDLMSDSNDTRSDAKSILEICRDKLGPQCFANKLYRVLSSPLDPNSCTISAILLRKSLIINKFCVPFLSFSVESQLSLKRKFLKLVDIPARPFNKELCHTVSALAASLLPKKDWPEFLPFLFELVESDKKRALLIAAYLAQYLGKGLKELHSVDLYCLHQILLECLKSREREDVRIAALGAAINFILCLEQKDLVNLQELLTEMVISGKQTMADAVNMLKLLIDLAGMKPTFLRKQIVEMVTTILLMANDHILEKETRRLAIEFVLTLVQFVLTLAEVEKMNPRLLKIGMEFEINMEEMWDDNKETENYGSWQGCVDGLSILSYRIGNDILTVALEVLQAYLDAPEWQKKHAAFFVLTQSIKSCPENASIHAIEVLASTLGEHLQVGCHLMLPALAEVMNDSPNQDMRVRTASIILNFSEYCTPENLKKHLDKNISSCLIVSKEIEEFAMGIRFTEWRDMLSEALVKLEMGIRFTKWRDRLSEEIEEFETGIRFTEWCDRLSEEAKEFQAKFSSWLGSLSEAWVQLWRNEERDFSPYLEFLMFPVFSTAQLDPDVAWYYGVNIIKAKAMACRVLCLCVDELTTLLFPLIGQVVDALIPFLKWYHDPPVVDGRVPSPDYYAKEIRIAAVEAMPKILDSAREVVESGNPVDYYQNMIGNVSDKVKHALTEASDVEPDGNVRYDILDALNDCVQ